MAKTQVNVLIVGAHASQHVFGTTLLDESLPAEVRITFYDRRPMEPRPQLTTLVRGVQQGRVRFVTKLPVREWFDVVIVAVSSDQHVPALQELLHKLQQLPTLFVLEKPLGVSIRDLLWYESESYQLQRRTIVNEPFHIMNSVDQLLRLAAVQPVAEVNLWSSKMRGVVNDHGGLKIFAIEFPHLFGAACRFAGRVLDVADCQVNNYYQHLDGRKNDDAIYVQAMANGVMYTIAQGLGSFTIGRNGALAVHHNPPRTRRIRLNFVNGASAELDLEPAFEGGGSRQSPAGVLCSYDSCGNLQDTTLIPDNPRRQFVETILQRVLEPSTPLPVGVGLHESLARNKALLNLRYSATQIVGMRIL
ncbi:MAG TPA: hypothetical protein VFO38_02230 [Candidatus Saccharimonadales bacterium]|nr:hypothetical protein [Candidatus Saccharimonadales bacterium]